MVSEPTEQAVGQEALNRWRYHQGLNGVPFRTQQSTAPTYKNGDPLHHQPKVVTDMKVRTFDLQEDTQRKEFEQALDMCAKGKGYVSKMETQYDDKIGGYKALLIWGVFFLEDPREEVSNVPTDQQIFS
jgi:hypothetical protein